MAHETTDNVQRLSRALISIMHTVHRLAGTVSRAGNLSPVQYRLLLLVHERGPMTIQQLSEQLGLAQSSTSELVERMVRNRWLRKEKDPADRRRTRVRIAARAARQLKRRMDAMTDLYRRMLEPLSPSEQEELIAAFEKVWDILRKSEELSGTSTRG